MFLLLIIGLVLGLFTKTWRAAGIMALALCSAAAALHIIPAILVALRGPGDLAQLTGYTLTLVVLDSAGGALGVVAGHALRRGVIAAKPHE